MRHWQIHSLNYWVTYEAVLAEVTRYARLKSVKECSSTTMKAKLAVHWITKTNGNVKAV